jgi:4-hydroxy-3-methylbut-2-enyl diphosphate reductase
MKRTVVVADQAGYCFGVHRALDIANEYLEGERKKVYSLGPIIHNPRVVEDFRRRGMTPVDSIDEVDEGIIVIRSHGVEKELLEKASAKGLDIADATCPFVKNAQRIAEKLFVEDYQLVIVGERRHPEVRGIVSYSGDDPLVVKDAEGLRSKDLGTKVGVLAQTTTPKENFIGVVSAILDSAHECRAYNTICNATLERQASAVELAGTVETMIVVGGKNSANTRRLAELCSLSGCATYHIESPDEITSEMLCGKKRIGITAGASTPRSQVDAVKKVCEELDA